VDVGGQEASRSKSDDTGNGDVIDIWPWDEVKIPKNVTSFLHVHGMA
jgi:hypothetical protein